MSIKLKLILIVLTIFLVFLATAILVSVDMIQNAFEAGQSKHTSEILDLSVNLLQASRDHVPISTDSLNLYEKQTMAALSEYNQRQICKDDVLKKLVILLLLNAIPFIILGYIAIMLAVSRITRPIVRLTKTIVLYPNLTPQDLKPDPRADKEVRLLTGQFNVMIEKIQMYQKRLQARSKVDGWMEMSRAIIHEAGNAITPAKNSIELLKNEDPQNANVIAVSRSIARMDDIFRHIRQFYKTREIVRGSFNVVDELEFLCKGYNVTFNNLTGYNAIAICAGKTETIQLFTNLIKNAVEAVLGCNKPDVKVEVSCGDIDLLICVSDNGCGIAIDSLDKIFSPGYSGKSTGFGIGLAIVQKIIILHEWSIAVESKLGDGTKFKTTIPKRDIIERTSTAA